MADHPKLPPEVLARIRAQAALDLTRLQVRYEDAKTNSTTAANLEAERIIYRAKHWSARGIGIVRKAEGRD